MQRKLRLEITVPLSNNGVAEFDKLLNRANDRSLSNFDWNKEADRLIRIHSNLPPQVVQSINDWEII